MKYGLKKASDCESVKNDGMKHQNHIGTDRNSRPERDKKNVRVFGLKRGFSPDAIKSIKSNRRCKRYNGHTMRKKC